MKSTFTILLRSQRLKNLYNKVDSTDYLNVNPKDLTLQMYMKNVNYHRTFKTPLDELTEAQRKSNTCSVTNSINRQPPME